VLDPATHLQRLRQGQHEGTAADAPRPRDPRWQQTDRALEHEIRTDTAAFYEHLRAAGYSAAAAATILGVPSRTLRHWCAAAAVPQAAPTSLGRRHQHGPAEQADWVIRFLHSHGPHVGLPTLRATFPTLARAELEELLGCYRHLWRATHPRGQYKLHWQVSGTVWAMDFTEVRQPIDAQYRYVFAVRDLASGLQLAWRAVPDLTLAAAVPELTLLFTVYGAPLVLKSDNGSAFRAEGLKAFLGRWGVWPLYSPPATPWYNGAIEASIGACKARTQFEAWRQGHEDGWTSTDLESARDLANTTARPRGPRGPTPAEAWAARRPLGDDERTVFAAAVERLEAAARSEQGIAPEADLDHYDQAALHRRVLKSALVQGGYLLLTRRRIPQRLFGPKRASIR
jgi:transposase InsO family protein